MKTLGFVLGLALVPALHSPAQVQVEVLLDQEQFLSGETLPAAIRIINRSGQTLHLGADPDWLTFTVESRDRFIVVKTGEVPVLGEFALESSKMATKRVDLAPYFALTRPGRYSLIATVRLKDWDGEVTSAPKNFDIINAAERWSQEFGVPPPPGVTNQPPEVRKYSLLEANYLRTRLRLYVRLTDASGARVFKIVPIGPVVSLSRPEPQLDSQNNLYILYQEGSHSFNYTVINPDGTVLAHQTYEYVNTRPRLQLNRDGTFGVMGGVRRIMPDDVPAPRPERAEPKASAP